MPVLVLKIPLFLITNF